MHERVEVVRAPVRHRERPGSVPVKLADDQLPDLAARVRDDVAEEVRPFIGGAGLAVQAFENAAQGLFRVHLGNLRARVFGSLTVCTYVARRRRERARHHPFGGRRELGRACKTYSIARF
jgi:hypothetical protein